MLTIPAFIARTIQDWFGLTPLPQEAEQQQQQQKQQQQQQQYSQQHQQRQQQQQRQQPQLLQQRQNAPPSPRPQQKPPGQARVGSTTTGLVPSPTAGQKPAQAAIPEVFQSKTVSSQHSAPAQSQVRNSPSPQAAKETEKALPADPTRHTSSRTLILTPSASEGRMSVEWAQQQVEKFKFDFDQADKDKSGTLSFEEVYDVLQRVGFKGSQEEAKFIFGHLDRDRNQRVTREEFTATLNNLPRLTIKEFVLRKAFLKLDKDGSGYLTRSEIIDATKSEAGLDIAAQKISDLLIYLARDDQDGKVSYEEFLHVFGVEEAATVLRQIFSKLDTDKSGFLSKEEILDAVKADNELKLKAEKISDLLIHWVKDLDKKISYEEFVQVWLQEKAKKPK